LRAETGLTILLTTHYMEEAESLADRIGIIDHGDLIVEGTPDGLKRAMGADIVAIGGSGDETAFARAIQDAPYVTHLSRHVQDDGAYVLQIGVDASELRLADLVSLAVASGFHIRTVSASQPSLADVFLSYTGHALRDA
jgi:ABC-2 type transport system ATP-binding protein